MEPFVRRFIRSSLIWLSAGVSLGLWMVLDPAALIFRPAHMHANLLGFVSMMIFGVAYHVLPRFAGTPLRSRQAASVHVLLANAGLSAMFCGWLLRPSTPELAHVLLPAGGLLSAAGTFLFVGNIWLTIGRPAQKVVLRAAPVVPS